MLPLAQDGVSSRLLPSLGPKDIVILYFRLFLPHFLNMEKPYGEVAKHSRVDTSIVRKELNTHLVILEPSSITQGSASPPQKRGTKYVNDRGQIIQNYL